MIRQKLLHSLLAFSAVAVGRLSILQGEDIKYADLKDKITIDRSAIKGEGGVVTSYADALAKVMPAVVTISSSKSIEMTSQRNPMQEELFRRMFPDVPEDFFERFEQEQEGVFETGKVELVDIPPARLAVRKFTGFAISCSSE